MTSHKVYYVNFREIKIGIFWFLQKQVIGIAHPFNLNDADSIGLIDSPYTHVDYWKNMQSVYPELRHYEYEQIPRGRVVFDANKEKAIVYMDKKLFNTVTATKIYDFFDIDSENAIPRKDPHYRT